MQIGMIGLGRMGSNMVRRLMLDGHTCVVYDLWPAAVEALQTEGAQGTTGLQDLVDQLTTPRAIWMMVPAQFVDDLLDDLAPRLHPGDCIIDGGNAWYRDSVRRGTKLAERGLHYVDVGTSGGVAGLERGYCLMIGGDAPVVARLETVFESLAPGEAAAPPTPMRQLLGDRASSSSQRGYLHCGPLGAGHYVKMVHNGIEYGLMAAYAEGMNLMHQADQGPVPYKFDIPEIAELWRRGSVIDSWLLDLVANALLEDADLGEFSGRVGDSGEGRWTINAAIEAGVPVPVLSAALFARFSSRGNASYADRLLSALRKQFGGHREALPGGTDGQN